MTDHIHAAEHPESDRVRSGGFTLWFTGLSGAGKTTIAHIVGPELDRRGLVVEYLDGDTVRTHLSKGLGFSKEDRDTHIERVGWVASRLTRQGGAVITAAISPYEETRNQARARVEDVERDIDGMRLKRRETEVNLESIIAAVQSALNFVRERDDREARARDHAIADVA